MKSSGTQHALRVVTLAIAAVVVACPVAAGTGHSVECSSCGLQANIRYGSGGRSQVVAVGYCCGCGKFVEIDAKKEAHQKVLEPIGTVFCHESGETHVLYTCPECRKPFVSIPEKALGTGREPARLHCPKCRKQTIEVTAVAKWD